MTEREEIEERFGQVAEIRRLAQSGVPLRLAPFRDITPHLSAVRPDGAVPDPRDLAEITPVLRVMAAINLQFACRADIPFLKALAGDVTGFPDLLDPLEGALDEEGNILDTASRLLMELRTRKRGLTARIRKRLEEIVREKRTAIFLQDDFRIREVADIPAGDEAEGPKETRLHKIVHDTALVENRFAVANLLDQRL